MSSTTTGAPLPWAWRLAAWPIAILGWAVVRGLVATWRFRIVEGEEHAEAALAAGEPVLFCAWHAWLYPIGSWTLKARVRRRLRTTFLVSRSRDGELAARIQRFWGGRVVRGSSSRGGREALRALHRALRRDGVSVFVAPDGPRGPERVFKAGSLVLSQVSGAPIIPIACRVSSFRRLRSWDRLVVPMPFARVELAFGAPFSPPREMDADEQGAALRRLEERLSDLEQGLMRA
jgi:lysophospholipid acyltransferase (LPLAT)-like uncharacterized protein